MHLGLGKNVIAIHRNDSQSKLRHTWWIAKDDHMLNLSVHCLNINKGFPTILIMHTNAPSR